MAPSRRNWRGISRRGAAKAGEELSRDLAKEVVANRGHRRREKRIAPAKAAPSTVGCLRKVTEDRPESSSRAGSLSRAVSRSALIKRQGDKGRGADCAPDKMGS